MLRSSSCGYYCGSLFGQRRVPPRSTAYRSRVRPGKEASSTTMDARNRGPDAHCLAAGECMPWGSGQGWGMRRGGRSVRIRTCLPQSPKVAGCCPNTRSQTATSAIPAEPRLSLSPDVPFRAPDAHALSLPEAATPRSTSRRSSVLELDKLSPGECRAWRRR